MSPTKEEILLFYNDDISFHKDALVNARSLTSYVKAYSYGSQDLTPTHWQTFIKKVEIADLESLFDDGSEVYQRLIADKELSQNDWLTVLSQNATDIRYPIAMSGDRAVILTNAAEIKQLIDSTALDKDLGRDDVDEVLPVK